MVADSSIGHAANSIDRRTEASAATTELTTVDSAGVLVLPEHNLYWHSLGWHLDFEKQHMRLLVLPALQETSRVEGLSSLC